MIKQARLHTSGYVRTVGKLPDLCCPYNMSSKLRHSKLMVVNLNMRCSTEHNSVFLNLSLSATR